MDVAASQKKNVALLAACQALLFTNNSTLIALNGLAGYALAPQKNLATAPVTGWVIGAAATTFFASLLMKRIGRRAGFTFGACVGIVGALICVAALSIANFWLFCLGTTVFGVYNAFGQYYRFAAADVATHDFKAKAISYVLAGGLVGGIIGPSLSRVTIDLLPTTYLARLSHADRLPRAGDRGAAVPRDPAADRSRGEGDRAGRSPRSLRSRRSSSRCSARRSATA